MVITISTDKPYDVVVESGALGRTGALLKPLFKAGSKAMIISETNVFPIYGERLAKSLSEAGFRVSSFVFEAGEPNKQLSTVMRRFCAASISCRCRPRCSRRSMRASAARPA